MLVLADKFNKMKVLIFIWSLLARYMLLIHSSAVPMATVDEFMVKDSKLMQKNFAKSLKKTWYSMVAEHKLDVLKNDLIIEASLDSCIEREGAANTDKATIEFNDIAKVLVSIFASILLSVSVSLKCKTTL